MADSKGKRKLKLRTIKVYPVANVWKYPFNPDKKGLYEVWEDDKEVIRFYLPDWNWDNPQYELLRDIFIRDLGYTCSDYKNLTFEEVVRILKRKKSQSMRNEINRIKSAVTQGLKAERRSRSKVTGATPTGQEAENEQTDREVKEYGKVEPLPKDLITLVVAAEEFIVSRSTLKRAIQNGRLKSYRPNRAAKNSPHKVRRAEVQAIWPKK